MPSALHSVRNGRVPISSYFEAHDSSILRTANYRCVADDFIALIRGLFLLFDFRMTVSTLRIDLFDLQSM